MMGAGAWKYGNFVIYWFMRLVRMSYKGAFDYTMDRGCDGELMFEERGRNEK